MQIKIILIILTIILTAFFSYISIRYQAKHQNATKKSPTIIIVVLGILLALFQSFLYDIVKPNVLLPQDANETIYIETNPYGGWGPDRQIFTCESLASYPVFNSIIDNPVLGDERTNFVQVGEAGSQSYYEIMPVVAGREYEVWIYFNNAQCC